MSDKQHRSPTSMEDESFRLALGKLDKLRLIESLYRGALKENEGLKARLASLEASGGTEAAANVRHSDSMTQLLLNATETRNLDHPAEFFEVLEMEKREEIELLKEKCQNSDKELKTVQQQRDDLQHEVEDLKSTMKVLEDKHPLSSSWENIRPRLNLTEREHTEPETVRLRRKIDELQNRVTELLNHNVKWNALCRELQIELDTVKSQLQQYQKAESCDRVTLMTDLKDQKKKTEEAEKIAQSASQHIDELEVKICELERQLKEREQQEKETIRVRVEEEVKTQAFVYEEQIKAFQEDFERERHDHEITKNLLDSVRKQWENIHAELLNKIQQLTDKTKQLEDKEQENKSLQEQLKQALGDQCLIRKRASELQCGSPMPSEWTCSKCTLINTRGFVKCVICETPREGEKTPEVFVVKKPPKMQGQLEEDGVCIEKSKWHCNKCTYGNAENVSSCIMCANPPASHSSVM